MQLTRLDRWLRERFVHETHIYTMRLPDALPRRARCQDLPDKPGRKYRHLVVVRQGKDVDKVIGALQRNSQMFTTRVVHRPVWYASMIAPENNRSVTWWVINKILLAAAAVSLIGIAMRVWDNPETRANILDSFRILKG